MKFQAAPALVNGEPVKANLDLGVPLELVEEDGIRKLDRVFGFGDFQQALDFTKEVGDLAEEEGHHPRLVTEWGRVNVTWWTHKIRNLHRNDFLMAAKSDQLHSQLSQAQVK